MSWMYLTLILSFVFIAVMDTNQQANANEYYPNYNNPDFYHEPTDQQAEYRTNLITYINSQVPSDIIIMIQQLLDDSYNNGYQDGLERSTYTPESTLTINEIFNEQSKSIIEQCVNEQNYYVNPSITVFASVKDNVLKIRGSGIHYDSSLSDQAVISLSPVNDYNGIKNIHLVEVMSDGKFVGFFDVSKIFYSDYVYDGTHYNGNIDSLGNYKIELQYDDQCGFINLEYHHIQNQSPILEIQNEDHVTTETPKPIDYSNACLDEHHNFQESTINISASKTWVKENTIGSPISGNGIVKNGWSNSAILTIQGSDGVGSVHEVPVESDGTFWKFFETRDMFVDDSLYGNYLISVMYNDQCGETSVDYMRGHPPSTTPTLEEIQEAVEDVSEAVEVKPYKIPIPSDSQNLVDAHRSHAQIIELDVNVACMDGKTSCFIPDKITIPVGGEVIFVVLDGYSHTIVQGTDRSKPYDGEFRVDNLVRGGQFSHVFDKAGEYPYFSNIHSNAHGIVIVE